MIGSGHFFHKPSSFSPRFQALYAVCDSFDQRAMIEISQHRSRKDLCHPLDDSIESPILSKPSDAKQNENLHRMIPMTRHKP
jgi:hypothetical protein